MFKKIKIHKVIDTFYTSFIDVMFLITMTILVQLSLLLLIINDPTPKADIERKAEYMITIKWDDDVDCDVDIWIETPVGNILNFQNPNVDLLALERDDLGSLGDEVYVDGKTIFSKGNEEIVMFRGVVPGDYIVNLNLYKCAAFISSAHHYVEGEAHENVNGIKELVQPLSVRVEFIDINPTLTTLFENAVNLSVNKEEITVFRFHLDNNGEYTYKGDLFKKLIEYEDADEGFFP